MADTPPLSQSTDFLRDRTVCHTASPRMLGDGSQARASGKARSPETARWAEDPGWAS